MNDRQEIDEIRRRLSIVDIIGEHVSLKKAGGQYKGLCPFHTEKSPSFNVNEERGLYKCFGCGEGGDLFKFVMKVNGLDFPGALAHLAARAGVTLTRRGRSKDSSWEAYGEINILARDHFSRNLLGAKGKAAREYFSERGIDAAMMDEFSLGLALDSFDDLLKAVRKGYGDEIIGACGLFAAGKKGGWYDRFRNRVIFPIRDTTGRVVAFGGRVYAGGENDGAKYVNSPETPLYTKGKHLYGLFQGKDAVKRSSQAILVEGYTDVIIAHKHGFANVIAALGTALTQDQVALIGRFAREVVLCYDADAAGRTAMEKGIDLVLDKGLSVRAAVIPDGKDPADFLEASGDRAFGDLIQGAKDFIDHRIAEALRRSTTTIDRARAARDLVASLRSIRDRLVRDSIVKTVAERFGVSEVSLLDEVRGAGGNSDDDAILITRTAEPRLDPELAVLKLITEEPSLRATARRHLTGGDFSKPPRTLLFNAVIEAADNDEPIVGDIGGRLDDLTLQLLAYIANIPMSSANRGVLLRDYIKAIRLKTIDSRISEYSVTLRNTELNEVDQSELAQKLNALIKEKTACMSGKWEINEGVQLT